jgi:Tfp pilus assembly protein PilN
MQTMEKKLQFFLAAAVFAATATGCGSAQPVPVTTRSTTETRKPAATLESRLVKVDSLIAEVVRLTNEYVRRRAPMIDKDRMDALTFADDARIILLNLQDKHPGLPEIERRLRRICNLLEFLKRN